MIDEDVNNIVDKPGLNLRYKYMHPRDVDKKWQQKIIFQASFLTRMTFLRDQGMKNDLLEKTNRWIEENYEKMYGKQFKSLDQIERATCKNSCI